MLVCVTTVVNANNPSQVITIDELLKLDTQAALLAARRSVVGSLERPGPAVVNDSEMLLLAIYGVGKSLTAEILIDAEPHVFRAARAQPVLGRSRTHTLERIVPPCVHLHNSGNPEVLCLGGRRP
jgi:hypothetical protein